MPEYLYALPGSKIYHSVIVEDDERPWFKCCGIPIDDLMSTRLAEGVGKKPDIYGHRRCRRCFP